MSIKTNSLTLLGAINDAYKTEMRLDPTIVTYGEDVGLEGGVFRTTVDLQAEFGEARCFDSPLAEAGIVGTAIGMAAAGLKPVVEMQFCGFTWPAFDHIISHIARYRNRTRSTIPLPLVIRIPVGGGIRALEHHSESIESILGNIPGLKIVEPSTPYDAKGLFIAAVRDPDPVIFLEPKRLYRAIKQEVPEQAYTISIGKAKVVTLGDQLTIVSYGAQMKETQDAVAKLKQDGYSIELIDLRTIYPYDRKTIIDSVQKTGRFLVVHEGSASFGVGAELIALVNETCFLNLEAPPTRLTGADTTFPYVRGEHYYMINAERIVYTAKKVLEY